jgi:tRNA-dihydrouridine synthase A
MRDAVALPVTVKHRIGLDRVESYAFVRDFVGTVATRGGCEVFIVHARNAWLQGLSPKQNREVPPLRYEVAHRLQADFPSLAIVVNGGIGTDEAIGGQLERLDGVMVGRHAYHEPWSMATWDTVHLGASDSLPDRDDVEDRYVAHLETLPARGGGWTHASRHMMGLRNGQPGARRWRQVWSDASLRHESPRRVQAMARAAMQRAQPEALPL